MSRKLERFLSEDQLNPKTGMAVHDRNVTTDSSLHWHNFLEIELITDGRGEQILNGQRNELSRGCLSVMRLTDFHQVTPGKYMRLINFMVDDKLLTEEMLHKLSVSQTMFYRLDEAEAVRMEQLFRLCMEENELKNPDKRYLNHLIICIFLRIFRLVPDSEKSGVSAIRPIQTALLYLHMHFRENPALKDVAEIAHYNTSHFSTTFHKELGMTYSEYLNTLKISYAKELLLSTDLKISDVCHECGFTSHSNFLRLFKERLGQSPMQFRKSAIDKPTVNPL